MLTIYFVDITGSKLASRAASTGAVQGYHNADYSVTLLFLGIILPDSAPH